VRIKTTEKLILTINKSYASYQRETLEGTYLIFCYKSFHAFEFPKFKSLISVFLNLFRSCSVDLRSLSKKIIEKFKRRCTVTR